MRQRTATLSLLLCGLAAACASAVPATPSPAQTPSAKASALPSAAPTVQSTPSPTATPIPDAYAGIAIVKIEAKLVQLTREPGYLGISANSVWAPTPGGLVRIDPATFALETVDDLRGFGMAATKSAVWATDGDANTVSRFDPATNRKTASIKLIGIPNGVSILGDSVWVTQHRLGTVTRLQEPSGTVVAKVEVGPSGTRGPQAVTATKTAVWVGISNIESVVRVDPSTNAVVATIATEASPCGGIAVQPGAVWVSTCYDDHFAIRIDPRSNRNAGLIDIGGYNGGAVLVDDYPWFPVENRLVRIDPETNRVDRVLEFAGTEFLGYGSTIGFGALWIGGLNGQVARVPIDALKN